MSKENVFFEMPPIIGDPSLPYKRAIQVISADFGVDFEKSGGITKMLDQLHQVVIRLPIPDSLLFHAAFESEKKFEVAYLIARLGQDTDNPFSDLLILEMRNIQVILYEEYHGDIVIGLEFKKISVIRGGYFLFRQGLKIYKEINYLSRDIKKRFKRMGF